jgi:hypothetical protein
MKGVFWPPRNPETSSPAGKPSGELPFRLCKKIFFQLLVSHKFFKDGSRRKEINNPWPKPAWPKWNEISKASPSQ